MNKRIRLMLNDGRVVEWLPAEYESYNCDNACLIINITRTWQAVYRKSALIKVLIG